MAKSAFPIFFSVSSSDIAFAEMVWDRFPDDWIYLYSKSGEEAAHMWDEISAQELPKSKILVIFWSHNYIKSPGCIREIKQAKTLVESNLIRPLVLRLDDCSLSWEDGLPEESKEVFSALRGAQYTL